MSPARGHVAAAETQAAIEALRPLLTAFLSNPFDPQAIRDWFPAMADHCPLWALQERAYRRFLSTDRTKLVLDPAWHLMVSVTDREASNQQAVTSAASVAWSHVVIEPQAVGDDVLPVAVRPRMMGDTSFAPKYLLYVYRATLMRRLDEKPLRESLKTKYLTLPEHSKKIYYSPGPDDSPWELPDELQDDLDVIQTLRDLIVTRDLATGRSRTDAEARIEDYLREIGVKSRGGRPSLPNLEDLVRELAKECRIWLSTEAACRDTEISADGLEKLEWWHCTHDPKMWAMRWAFPFLAQREIDYLRSARNEDDRLTTVLLIHNRFHEFLNLATTADYALGTPATITLTLPDQNPLPTLRLARSAGRRMT